MGDATREDRTICNSSHLESGGAGINFMVDREGMQLPAFIVRHSDVAYAYLNQCAHLALELDWERGEFFDEFEEYIICANHGAMFDPVTGECVNGPCYGAFLVQIEIEESAGFICINDNNLQLISRSE